MIDIIFSKKNNQIIDVKVKGHSNFSSYGTDIVCASVSSTVLMTINGMCELLKVDVKYTIEDGKVFANIKHLDYKDIEKCQVLLESLCIFLSEIAIKYPKNVKFKIREV